MYRIGIGYDIHKLVTGRKLILGGVVIPYSKGLLGHSDADALLHAIADAMLGAASKGDIGEHFPDTAPEYKDASSSELLKTAGAIVKKTGYVVRNIDTIVIAEEPKLGPFKETISKNIARLLRINEDAVAVKAKTNEGLGPVGAGEAVAAYAVVLLAKKTKGE